MIADARQRGMMHASQQARLSLKLFAQSFVSEERLFQRHDGVETLVHRFIHGPHAALAELTNNPITTL